MNMLRLGKEPWITAGRMLIVMVGLKLKHQMPKILLLAVLIIIVPK